MSAPTCPKCNAAQEDGVSRVFACGSISISPFMGVHQSDRCKLTVAERERDEWQARALSMSAFIPGGTLCGDLQKAKDEFLEMKRDRDEARAIVAAHELCHNLGKVGPREFADGCAAEVWRWWRTDK